MKPELLYFDVSPKIVPADRDAEISIRPLFNHCRLSDKKSYRVSHSPIKGFSDINRNTDKSKIDMCIESGVMHIRGHFEAEQEHILLLEEKNGDEWKQIGDFRLYSLEEDLFHRRPYKGDIHLHSWYSDGRESPGYVAASCRRIGFDFMAITDHRKYQPSLEAQKVRLPDLGGK